MNKKSIHMNIDEILYIRSKTVIPNRTKDYEDYLRRKIACGDRKELLKKEMEELESKKIFLQKEIDIEDSLADKIKEEEDEKIEVFNGVVETVIKIIQNEGSIGLDKLEEISDLRGVSLAELKANIPEELRDKIVKFHLKFTNNKRIIYD